MLDRNSKVAPDLRAGSLGSLHVADLASQAEVTPATVRYYSRIGLLSSGREPENGYRCFTTADTHRVEFIRQAQALGLTIGDIKEILGVIHHGGESCQLVKSRVKRRLITLQERISAMQATEARIVQAIAEWDEMKDLTPGEGELCPLIDRLHVINEAAVLK